MALGPSFLADFEQGAYLALLEIFPNVGIEGYFFHLSKRLDYKVKELGLMAKYQDDYDFRFRVKKLSALALIPVEDLITVYEALADTFEEDELELISYFEATWIGGVVGRRQRRTPTRFPAATRTTNSYLLDQLVQQTPWRRFITRSTRWLLVNIHRYGCS